VAAAEILDELVTRGQVGETGAAPD
jgi:hypothetical protein